MAHNDKLKSDDALVITLACGLTVREAAQEAGFSERHIDGLTILSSAGGRWG